jgi:hypothetical protein
MLNSRNTARKPLLYFDEETGQNRPLRYARNQKTPFEDEHDGHAILEPIIFETKPKEPPKTIFDVDDVVKIDEDTSTSSTSNDTSDTSSGSSGAKKVILL